MYTKFISIIAMLILVWMSHAVVHASWTQHTEELVMLYCPEVTNLKIDLLTGQIEGIDNLGNLWTGLTNRKFSPDNAYLSRVYWRDDSWSTCLYHSNKDAWVISASLPMPNELRGKFKLANPPWGDWGVNVKGCGSPNIFPPGVTPDYCPLVKNDP